MAQIDDWRDFISRNMDEVLRRLKPIRKPLERNPVVVKYLLVIGRAEEKEHRADMRARLASLGGDDLEIKTYDSLISAYETGPRYKKNILKLKQTRFAFKYLNYAHGIFGWYGPDDLVVSPTQSTALIAEGYQMDEWKRGKLLVVNGKTVNLAGN